MTEAITHMLNVQERQRKWLIETLAKTEKRIEELRTNPTATDLAAQLVTVRLIAR